MKFIYTLSISLGLLISIIFLPLCASAEDSTSINSFSQTPFKAITLPRTSTLVFFNDNGSGSDPLAKKEGEAFECEGDNPQNTSGGSYVCSNSFATYGCTEECACCFYEEKYQKEDGRPNRIVGSVKP